MPQANYTSYTSTTQQDTTATTTSVAGTYTYVISTSADRWVPALTAFYTSRSDARNAKRLLSASAPGTSYYIFRFANTDMSRVS